ncbi:MAG: hypothetical protein WC764_00475 [Candidatus Paceibacterota bacterium]
MIDSTIHERAVALRRQGKSYSEIRKVIPVAKSTLTEWFVDVGLSKRQKQIFTEKRRAGQRRGAAARKAKRVRIQTEIIELARTEIGKLSDRDLLIIGTCLYWAEGSKEKEYSAGSGLKFSNSDWRMVKVFILFLKFILRLDNNEIKYELYLHNAKRDDLEKILNFWCNRLKLPVGSITHIYYKKGNPKTKRRNVGEEYVGVLRVCPKSSSHLVRRIAGWTEGICENQWGIV